MAAWFANGLVILIEATLRVRRMRGIEGADVKI
jgi:hypothetical protein